MSNDSAEKVHFVTVTLSSVPTYGPLDKAIAELIALKKYEKDFTNLSLSEEQDPYGDGHNHVLEGTRPENAEEREVRLARERQQAEWDLAQFEALKKKLGK